MFYADFEWNDDDQLVNGNYVMHHTDVDREVSHLLLPGVDEHVEIVWLSTQSVEVAYRLVTPTATYEWHVGEADDACHLAESRSEQIANTPDYE